MNLPPVNVPVHPTMTHFSVQGGELLVGGMALSRLSERVGQAVLRL